MHIKKFLSVVLFAFFLFVSSSQGAFFDGKNSTLNVPDEINILDSFDIGIVKADESTKYLQMNGDCYFFDSKNNKLFNYTGEDKIKLVSGLYGKDGNIYKKNSCSIDFLNDSKQKIDSINFNLDIAELDLSLNIPSGAKKQDGLEGEYPILWENNNDNDGLRVMLDVSNYHNVRDYQFYKGSKVPNDVHLSQISPENQFKLNQQRQIRYGSNNTPIKYETIGNMAGSNAAIYYSSDMDADYSWIDEYSSDTTSSPVIEIILFYDAGYVYINMFGTKYPVPAAEVQNEDTAGLNNLWTIVQSFRLNGKTSGFELEYVEEEEEEEDNYCYDQSGCGEGELCGACGTCKPKEEMHDLSMLSIKNFNMNPKWTSKEIPNTTYNRMIVRTYPTMNFYDSQGKEVSACNITIDSMKELHVGGEMQASKMYAGFIDGSLLDDRISKKECTLSFPEPSCPLIISPNDEKKIVGKTGDITEKVKFTAYKGNSKFFEIEDSYTLKKIDFDFDVKANSFQMQEGGSKPLTLIFKHKYAKDIYTKFKVIGSNSGSIEHNGKDRNILYANFKPYVSDKIIYHAPDDLGNFNIGEAIKNLSWSALQWKAAGESTEATAMNFGGAFLEGGAAALKGKQLRNSLALITVTNFANKNKKRAELLKKLKTSGEILTQVAEDSDKLYKGYAYMKGFYGNKGLPGSFIKDVDEAGTSSGGGASTYEKALGIGMVGIDISQIAVGIITFLPNQVPVLNFAPAAAESAFARVTNAVKAHLERNLKEARIQRAEEKFAPIFISVTAQDGNGWTIENGIISLRVAYHQLAGK